jgi:hypothetical protein
MNNDLVLIMPIRLAIANGLPSQDVVFVSSCSCGNAFNVRCLEDGRIYRIEGDVDMVDKWREKK